MTPKIKLKKGPGTVLLIMFLAIILTACGETSSSSNATVAPPATTTSQATTSSPTSSQPPTAAITQGSDISQPAGVTTNVSLVKAITQPKVIRVSQDGYRNKIEFTEIPPITDGNPTFLWFDAEG